MNKVYTEDGIYLEELNDGQVRIGLSAYGSDAVGEVSYFTFLNEDELVADQPFFSVEGSKAVTDMVAPISGKVVERHDALVDEPEILNALDEKEKWIVTVQTEQAVAWDQFLAEDLPIEEA
ncbi:glycine cleavage system protein H [Aerococcus agrisoli]|uniref:Glycine cleavage system protein H n=1 Tax=Aerococcus agrisoli TaxID=2487350 RepID=A0A3N4GM06_9LACT|nr:glycine cleavage system protein H [Aerococcus agrisoli]RPA60151.1 glycine cleavage system protein H [Aerococcus agrisoli]